MAKIRTVFFFLKGFILAVIVNSFLFMIRLEEWVILSRGIGLISLILLGYYYIKEKVTGKKIYVSY